MTTQPATRHDIFDRVLDAARQLSASASLTEILSVIINAMRDLLGAERASVLEYDASRDVLFSTVAHGLGELKMRPDTGIAGCCARERRIVNVADAYADARFNRDIDRRTGFRTTSLLAVPLLADGEELIGVAQVLNKRGGDFDERDEEIAEALASLAAVAIKRGRLVEDRLVRQKLERDLEVARRIQAKTFPARLPELDGFELAARNQPADLTGGDAYDVVEYPDGTGRVLLLLADAMGHGVGPALSVTEIRSMLRMAVRLTSGGSQLAGVLRHMNQQLCEDLPRGHFITAWLGELDARSRALLSFSVGQAPLLWYRAERGSVETIEADMPPLGLMPDLEVTPRLVTLAAGDIFAVMSDGFFEAADGAGHRFGVERVGQVIAEHAHEPAVRILVALEAALASFTGSRPAGDDRTAVIIRRLHRG